MSSEIVQFGGIHDNLMRVIQNELEWVEFQHYTKDPYFSSLLDAIQNLPQLQPHLRDVVVSKFYELSHYVSQKFKELIDVCIMEVHCMQEKALQIRQELLKEKDRAQGLEEVIQNQEKGLAKWEQEYESIKGQYDDVVARLEERKERAEREREEFKRAFLQVREENESYRLKLQDLKAEMITITDQLESEKKQSQRLNGDLQLHMRKMSQTQRQINSSAKKLSFQERRVLELEEELQKIKRQIENTKKQEHQSTADSKQQKEFIGRYTNSNIVSNKGSEIQRSKLQDDVGVGFMDPQFLSMFPKEPSITQTQTDYKPVKNYEQAQTQTDNKPVLSHQKAKIDASICLQKTSDNKSVLNYEKSIFNYSVSEPSMDIQSSPKMAVPDFYFAHYLLTVQSMKLKLGQERLYGIDMSARYSEMIEAGTPFHQWDEWIGCRLQELSEIKS